MVFPAEVDFGEGFDSVYKDVSNFVEEKLTAYLNTHPDMADLLIEVIAENEVENDSHFKGGAFYFLKEY